MPWIDEDGTIHYEDRGTYNQRARRRALMPAGKLAMIVILSGVALGAAVLAAGILAGWF